MILRASPGSLAGMRIALATDTWAPQLNGVTRTLDRLVREATARGADVRIYTAADPAARRDPGVRRFPSIPFSGYPQLRLAWPGRRALLGEWNSWRPDLVHAATPFGIGLAARAAAHSSGIPFVTSYHTSLGAYARFYRLGWLTDPGWRFLRWFHNGGRRTWCPTRAIASELEGRGFRDTALWGRGVDTQAFHPCFRSLEFRRAHGVRDTEFLVLYVGRLAREKGIDALIAGMRTLDASQPGRARLMLVGDGPYEAAIRAAAPARTVFTGTLSGHELSAAFASGDILAFPSLTDTFGNVLLEAMASGTPVLAADCAVAREQLGTDGGFLFDSRRATAFAQRLDALVGDPAARHIAADVARRRAEGRTWTCVFDDLFAEYVELAGPVRAQGRDVPRVGSARGPLPPRVLTNSVVPEGHHRVHA